MGWTFWSSSDFPHGTVKIRDPSDGSMRKVKDHKLKPFLKRNDALGETIALERTPYNPP